MEKIRSEWLDRNPGEDGLEGVLAGKQTGRKYGPAPRRRPQPTNPTPLTTWQRFAHYIAQPRPGCSPTEITLRQQRRIRKAGNAAGLPMHRYRIDKKPGYGVDMRPLDEAQAAQQLDLRRKAGV